MAYFIISRMTLRTFLFIIFRYNLVTIAKGGQGVRQTVVLGHHGLDAAVVRLGRLEARALQFLHTFEKQLYAEFEEQEEDAW